ncbi:hypothetical protein ACFLVP_03285 [Chloroflexota bacterium]
MLARRLIIVASFFTVMALSFVVVFVFYRTPASDPWPEDYTSIFSYAIDDVGSDFDQEVSDAPTYIDQIDYPPINITKVLLGVEDNYLYMRLDYAGEVPSLPYQIIPAGEVEAQTVEAQGTNVVFEVDNNPDTGAIGVDIFFAVNFDYGKRTQVYTNYDFSGTDDIHENNQHMEGEVGDGGMGYDYVIVRYDISKLGSFFPRGNTVMVGFWSEAESDLYHHFDFEETDQIEWTIPQ